MFTSPASPTSRRSGRPAILAVTATLALLVPTARPVSAQSPAAPARTWEVRISSGSFVPTGDQRDVINDGQFNAAQVSWLVRPSLAITGTFGWALSRDLATSGSPKLDVFTSDLGVELRTATWFADRAVTLSPFAGLGAGARSYNYRKLDVGATHNLAGYGAIGGEVGFGRLGLRVEARNYVAGLKPLAGNGVSATSNDVVYMAALRFNRNRASQK
jgi:hypothetical protein